MDGPSYFSEHFWLNAPLSLINCSNLLEGVVEIEILVCLVVSGPEVLQFPLEILVVDSELLEFLQHVEEYIRVYHEHSVVSKGLSDFIVIDEHLLFRVIFKDQSRIIELKVKYERLRLLVKSVDSCIGRQKVNFLRIGQYRVLIKFAYAALFVKLPVSILKVVLSLCQEVFFLKPF